MSILKAQNVSKRFIGSGREFSAVKDASIEVKEGELTVISGRSGSGKSTLLNMLAGTLRPSSGWVILQGKDIYTLKDSVRSALRGTRMGIVPQGKSIIMSLSVTDNVLLPYIIRNDETAELTERAYGLLDRLKLSDLRAVKPSGLSGGELRRVAIARALISRPDILLCDEPTGDLDDVSTGIVLDILREEADRGAAVLMVTHESDAMDRGDVIYTMDAGCLLASGN